MSGFGSGHALTQPPSHPGLDVVIAARGRSEKIRLDNGSELTSHHFLCRGIDRRIELNHIEPGKPVQNAHIESFNGRLRDECLNTSWFPNLWDERKRDMNPSGA
jgi:putative transposase